MVRLFKILLLVAATFLVQSTGEAARDLALPSDRGRLQLVVVEVDGCLYCGIFRRDVAPAYIDSPRGRDVPMRFMDLNDPASDSLRLSAPIVTVPTVILLKDNIEVGRIPGYVGPENFFHSVHRLFDLAGE